ncbi:MAG: DUF2062 domain-containing protein [Pseudomonadota bacterium]
MKGSVRRWLASIRQHKNFHANPRLIAWLQNPFFSQINKHSVAGGVFIGLFCAFIPLPAQMPLAAIMAIIFRVNGLIAMIGTWVSNPFTFPPLIYVAYHIGALLIGEKPHADFETVESGVKLLPYLGPIFLGSLCLGMGSAISGYLLVRILWRLSVIRQWKLRRAGRRLLKKIVPSNTFHKNNSI